MRKIPIGSAKVHVEMDYYLSGSVLAGTINSGVTSVRSDFEVTSDASEVETAVPVTSTLKLNGKEATDQLNES